MRLNTFHGNPQLIQIVIHLSLGNWYDQQRCGSSSIWQRCVSRALVSQWDQHWLHNASRPQGCTLHNKTKGCLHTFLHWLHNVPRPNTWGMHNVRCSLHHRPMGHLHTFCTACTLLQGLRAAQCAMHIAQKGYGLFARFFHWFQNAPRHQGCTLHNKTRGRLHPFFELIAQCVKAWGMHNAHCTIKSSGPFAHFSGLIAQCVNIGRGAHCTAKPGPTWTHF